TPGGGERYILTLATALASDKKLTVVTPNPYSQLRLLSLGRELDLDLSESGVMTHKEFISGPPPELMFTLGNHIVPPVAAHGEASWYHCQFPFPREINANDASCSLLAGYRGIIVNSEYSKKHTLHALEAYNLSVPIEIIHPPVL